MKKIFFPIKFFYPFQKGGYAISTYNLAKNLVYFRIIFCDLPVYSELIKDIFSNNNIIVNCDNWIFFQP